MATAPAHVEDKLDDAWLQFAQESPCDKSEPQDDQKIADAVMGSVAGDGGSQPSHPLLVPKKKKPLKVALEAMIRGYAKYVEGDSDDEEKKPVPNEECHHNVAAWHNVEHP